MSDDPQANGAPAPEELKPESEGSSSTEESQPTDSKALEAAKEAARNRRSSYRPSHKATFIGLGVVASILVLNAVGLAFILRNNDAEAEKAKKETITLSASTLNSLGVSRNNAKAEGIELTINPNTQFGGTVTIAGNTTIAGELKLNNKFVAPEGAFNKLQGGDTAVDKLNVNGDATVSNLNMRNDLAVAGATRLQGQVTISQLTTINNNLNVTGSLSVGGNLAFKSLSLSSLTLGGHLITNGQVPLVSAGGAVGNSGTVSASGNDTSGTIAVNIGVGAVSGTLVNVTFRQQYATTPHVVVTPVGRYVPFYINRTTAGFSIVTTAALSPGGYAFDFFVAQ